MPKYKKSVSPEEPPRISLSSHGSKVFNEKTGQLSPVNETGGVVVADGAIPKKRRRPKEPEIQLNHKKRCLIAGLIMLSLLTLAASASAIALPYWSYSGVSNNTFVFEISEGILQQCMYPQTVNETCGFLKFQNKPAWVLGTAGCWMLGFILYLVFGLMSFCLCTETCRSNKYCAAILVIGSACSGVMYLIALFVWAFMSEASILRSSVVYVDVAFYMAGVACGLTFLTTFMLALSVTILYPDTYDKRFRDDDSDMS